MQLIEASVRRPVFATMLIAALVVFGFFAYPKMGVELYPSVELPVVTATMVYPGADPETMEQKVAEPVEEALQAMNGIRRMTSQNYESVSSVILEFDLTVDSNVALQEAKDKISAIQINLPQGMEPPVVQRFNTGSAPVMSVSISGDVSPRVLTEIADKRVKQRIQRVQGVGTINLLGGREREIKIDVSLEKLRAYGLTIQDVEQAIMAQNLDLPAGLVEMGNEELTLKTRGEVQTLEELGAILISGIGGAQIRVRDVAELSDGMQEKRSHSQLNDQSAVALEILKQGDANVVAVCKKIREELEKLRPELEAKGITLSVPMDNSKFTERSIRDVQVDLLIGAVFTVIIIFVFLHSGPATMISALAIPTSIIGTVAFMQWLGFTFNYMTTLALSLSIGILVDDAIVVIENIVRHLHMGKGGRRAALEGTREIALPVLATTFSLVSVFVPVAFMDGIVGRFFFQFGVTVAVAVIISTLVSFTLTPMLSARMLKPEPERKLIVFRLFDAVMAWAERIYGGVIRLALRFPWLVILGAIGLLAGSLMLAMKVPMEFLPPEDRSEFAVVVETPAGTSLSQTTQAVDRVQREIRSALPAVSLTFATVSGGNNGQTNQGKIRVLLDRGNTRDFSQQDATAFLRSHLAGVQGADVRIEEIDPMGSSFRTQPVQFAIQGNDMAELTRVSNAITQELRQVPGFVDVDSTLRSGKPELLIEVDRERAADLGVPLSVVATTIRSMVADDPSGTFKADGELHDIVVRLPKEERDAADRLGEIQVRSRMGQLIDLSSLVRITSSSGPSKIERFDRQRMALILAELDKIPLGEATKTVEAIAAKHVSAELDTSWLGDAELMEDTAVAMQAVMALSVALAYMILAAQFNSFVQPIVIMVSLPFSIVGAVGATYLAGMSISIFSFIGMLMLMGLVTKAAILLVDLTNQERARGTSLQDAIVIAGTTRLRPILMTTASTIVGMLPIALALSEGGETRAPMAVCVIGGMIVATGLTLIFIPSVFLLTTRVLEHLGFDGFEDDDDDDATPMDEMSDSRNTEELLITPSA